LEEVLEKYWEEIAMIHMEPILCNGGCCPPRPGYLERVRDLCTRYGIVLSFDEIITGFRVALNGAQGMLGITPDIATFGKAMAGGIPMSAVAGKKEIMDLLLERKVIGAGIQWVSLGVAASLATLKFSRKIRSHYKRIEKYQKVDGWSERDQRETGIPTLIQGPRGIFFTLFVEKKVAYSVRDLGGVDWEKQDRFYNILVGEGVLLMFGGRWYLSGGLTDADIDKALECTDRAMAKL
jgi:glutamate-1-semialdehyde 2,1-aminomutase